MSIAGIPSLGGPPDRNSFRGTSAFEKSVSQDAESGGGGEGLAEPRTGRVLRELLLEAFERLVDALLLGLRLSAAGEEYGRGDHEERDGLQTRHRKAPKLSAPE